MSTVELIGPVLLLLGMWTGPASLGTAGRLPEAAVQNPLLRAHFRQVVRESRAIISPDGRRIYRPDFFLDERVDRLVRRFLIDLIQRRDDLKQSLEAAQLARERAVLQPKNREARLVLAANLVELGKRASRLRALMKPVVIELNRGGVADLPPPVPFRVGGFEQEIKALTEEARQADELIHAFFFEPSHTVDAGTLEKGNMLVRLERVARLAREMVRVLSSD